MSRAAERFAAALDRALSACAFDALADVLLHRATADDGLAPAVGREAVIADIVALAAGGLGSRTRWRVGGAMFIVSTESGPTITRAGPLVMARAPDAAHAWWVHGENDRVAGLTSIAVRETHPPEAAAALGRAHPTHRPLGELRSGRGQYASTVPADASPGRTLAARLDARALADVPEPARRAALAVLARLPDAVWTLDDESADGERSAILLRVQGHADGRRVSLPAVAVLPEGELSIDLLALEAHAFRPFLGEAS